MTEMLGGRPTPDGIVELSGMADAAALRAVADWTMPTSGMAPLRALSREFAGDQWAQGRYLAGILTVWIDELRADAVDRGADAPDPAVTANRAPDLGPELELGRYLSDGVRANVITTVRETSARIAVRLDAADGPIIAATGVARDVDRDGFRLGPRTDERDGASVWVRFPPSDEIARIEHYDRGYRLHLRTGLVLTITRRERA